MLTRDQINTDMSNYTMRNLDICLQNGAGAKKPQATKAELYALAKKLGVPKRSTMNKEELLNALKRVARSKK